MFSFSKPFPDTLLSRLLSAIYTGVIDLRNRWYDKHDGYHPGVPVISIGGVHAGGTGKTPVVSMTARYLIEQGFEVAILSRGYKRTVSKPIILAPNQELPWNFIGDEPAMLRKYLPETWLGIGPDRCENARDVVEKMNGKNRIIILDDGFQHRKLHREKDVVCLPPDPFSDKCFPAGYLREPLSALSRAHALCLIGSPADAEIMDTSAFKLRNLYKQACVLIFFQTAENWVNLQTGRILPEPPLQQPAVVCGIARPRRFISAIEDLKIKYQSIHIFDDHHVFKKKELERITCRSADGILTTAKDACRLNSIKFLVQNHPIWYLSIKLKPRDNLTMEHFFSLFNTFQINHDNDKK